MLDLLSKYKKVVDLGNITKASEELFITQSALTQSLQKLERYYKCKLLIRSRSGVTPTEIGKTVYEYAKNSLQEANNIQEKINEYKKISEKNIQMGMIDNVGLIFVRNIYKKLIEDNPELQLQLEIDNSSRLISQVQKQHIDFAIITKPKKKLTHTFHQEHFATEPMFLVGDPKTTKVISHPRDIKKVAFISYNKKSKTHTQIAQTFNSNKINVQYKIHSSSPDFMLEMVRQGIGIAVLPQNLVQEDINTKTLRTIDIGIQFSRKLDLISLKRTYLSEVTKEFISDLRSAYNPS